MSPFLCKASPLPHPILLHVTVYEHSPKIIIQSDAYAIHEQRNKSIQSILNRHVFGTRNAHHAFEAFDRVLVALTNDSFVLTLSIS
jgi:hypothetical protein